MKFIIQAIEILITKVSEASLQQAATKLKRPAERQAVLAFALDSFRQAPTTKVTESTARHQLFELLLPHIDNQDYFFFSPTQAQLSQLQDELSNIIAAEKLINTLPLHAAVQHWNDNLRPQTTADITALLDQLSPQRLCEFFLHACTLQSTEAADTITLSLPQLSKAIQQINTTPSANTGFVKQVIHAAQTLARTNTELSPITLHSLLQHMPTDVGDHRNHLLETFSAYLSTHPYFQQLLQQQQQKQTDLIQHAIEFLTDLQRNEFHLQSFMPTAQHESTLKQLIDLCTQNSVSSRELKDYLNRLALFHFPSSFAIIACSELGGMTSAAKALQNHLHNFDLASHICKQIEALPQHFSLKLKKKLKPVDKALHKYFILHRLATLYARMERENNLSEIMCLLTTLFPYQLLIWVKNISRQQHGTRPKDICDLKRDILESIEYVHEDLTLAPAPDMIFHQLVSRLCQLENTDQHRTGLIHIMAHKDKRQFYFTRELCQLFTVNNFCNETLNQKQEQHIIKLIYQHLPDLKRMQNINKQRLRQSRATGSVYIVIPSNTDRYSQVTIVTQDKALDTQGITRPRDYKLALTQLAKWIEHKHQKIENNHDFCLLMLQACLQYMNKQPVTRDLQLLRQVLINENQNPTVCITPGNAERYQTALGILRTLIQKNTGDQYTVQALHIAQKRVTQRHDIISTILNGNQDIRFSYLKRNAGLTLYRTRCSAEIMHQYIPTYNQANSLTGWYHLSIEGNNVLVVSPTKDNAIQYKRLVQSVAGTQQPNLSQQQIKSELPRNKTNNRIGDTNNNRQNIFSCYLNGFSCFSNPSVRHSSKIKGREPESKNNGLANPQTT